MLRVGKKRLDFFCNGVLQSTIPIHQELSSPFDIDLLVNAFKNENHHTTITGHLDAKFDAVALWDLFLTDNQVAFLSGVGKVNLSKTMTPLDQAILDYNAFFDASVNKDTATCNKLWKSLWKLAAQDNSRPIYHLSQPFGFVHDPAGAYYYENRYHVFSYRNILDVLKYCSLDHYVSNDLVHWNQWPIGPWADTCFDVGGIWLMNHFIDDDGVPSVIYTSVGVNAGDKYGILARSRDGLISYGDKKVVLAEYHHDGHTWKEGDTWYTITAWYTIGAHPARRPDGLGHGVRLWSSPDLENWTELGEIFASRGGMEFPYLLSFEDKDVMMLGGRPVRYWVGKFDRQKIKFIPDHPDGLLLDYTNPFHCFNPLIVDDKGPEGKPRRIIMAMFPFLGGGGADGMLPWNGVHAMPRSLELDKDRLRQEPLPEFETLLGQHESQREITIKPGMSSFISTRGDALEIDASFEPGDAKRFGLRICVSDDRSRGVQVWFDTTTGEYGVDGQDLFFNGHGPSYIQKGQPVRMRVFIDKQFIETFVNGQTCTTASRDKDLRDTGLDLFSEGGTARCTKLDVWKMNRAITK